jgi:3'-phosphoadenosine 5'-phosphosulfate (PAPS) 3'-phosphatase
VSSSSSLFRAISPHVTTMEGFWCLDPIDGTKGFLRGEQYAVCLALIVDSKVQLGVIGCPNLPQDASQPDGPRGAMFVAVRGQGAQQVRSQFCPIMARLIAACRCQSTVQILAHFVSLTLRQTSSTSWNPWKLLILPIRSLHA